MTEMRMTFGIFNTGDIAQYCEPTPGMLRQYGLRVYAWDEEKDAPILDVTPPEDGSLGMVLASEVRETYSGSTLYYKLLIGERYLWIASDLLRTPKRDNSL